MLAVYDGVAWRAPGAADVEFVFGREVGAQPFAGLFYTVKRHRRSR